MIWVKQLDCSEIVIFSRIKLGLWLKVFLVFSWPWSLRWPCSHNQQKFPLVLRLWLFYWGKRPRIHTFQCFLGAYLQNFHQRWIWSVGTMLLLNFFSFSQTFLPFLVQRIPNFSFLFSPIFFLRLLAFSRLKLFLPLEFIFFLRWWFQVHFYLSLFFSFLSS